MDNPEDRQGRSIRTSKEKQGQGSKSKDKEAKARTRKKKRGSEKRKGMDSKGKGEQGKENSRENSKEQGKGQENDQNPKTQGQNTKTQGQNPKTQDQNTKTKDQNPKTQDQNTKTKDQNKEKIEALQRKAYALAKEGDYTQSLQLLESLYQNHGIHSWDVVFYRQFYALGREGLEESAFSHVEEINQAVIDSFAVVLAQDVDILETLVCFQDVYDQIWDLSTRLLTYAHSRFYGGVKGKSVTESFYLKEKNLYLDRLHQVLNLSQNFINALGNLSQFTTVNLDLVWDFFQSNDGIYSFLQAYQGDTLYKEKRMENLKVIQLKRPDYQGATLPTVVEPAELREATQDKDAGSQKKKGFFGRFFS